MDPRIDPPHVHTLSPHARARAALAAVLVALESAELVPGHQGEVYLVGRVAGGLDAIDLSITATGGFQLSLCGVVTRADLRLLGREAIAPPAPTAAAERAGPG